MELIHGQLYHAAEENDFEKFRDLIEQGADVDEFYEDDMNISTKYILHVCCAKGRCEMVKFLLDSGAYLQVVDAVGQTPLMYCFSTQFVEVAKILLQKDPLIVDDQDGHGKSSLHIAVETGNIESIKMLLDHDVNVDIQNSEGYTPLMLCSYATTDQDHMNTVLQILVDAGADVNIKERKSKKTALQLAAVILNLKAVEILLAAGSDPNLHDAAGRTPITSAMIRNVRPNRDINPDLVALIIMSIQCGADLNLKQCEYINPLVTAVSLQAESLVNLFLSYGADVNITFPTGTTGILLATTKNDLPCIKQLIFFNTRLNMKGYVYKRREQIEYHVDPMEYAVQEGQFGLVKLFALAGYDMNNLKYLFGNGTAPEKLLENREMQEWLETRASNTQTLLELCVKTIRHLLGPVPSQKVKQLPLPSRLQGFLLLSHVLDFH